MGHAPLPLQAARPYHEPAYETWTDVEDRSRDDLPTVVYEAPDARHHDGAQATVIVVVQATPGHAGVPAAGAVNTLVYQAGPIPVSPSEPLSPGLPAGPRPGVQKEYVQTEIGMTASEMLEMQRQERLRRRAREERVHLEPESSPVCAPSRIPRLSGLFGR
jgi:hypothetical protein